MTGLRLRALKVATLLGAATLLLGLATPAFAGNSQSGQGAIILNPGGGVATNGSDGVRLVVNGAPDLTSWIGSDQLYFANTYQWCCGGTSPMINIGGELFGEAGAANQATSWSSIQLTQQSGAVEVLPVGSDSTSSTTTGSASVTVRYTASKNGLEYLVDRQILYTFPNNFYRENYTFTIPAGNTETVKFYQGGDAAPGSSDSGRGFSVSSPTVAAYEVNPLSGIYVSYQQVIGDVPFDGLYAAGFSAPWPTMQAGGDIGFVTDTNQHDAGLDMQWTLGSSPGVYLRSMITQAGFQAVQVTAAFSTPSVEVSQPVNLIFQIVNTDFSAQSGLAFSALLPTGLSIAAEPTNTCGGTLIANTGSNSVAISSATVASGSNCSVSVPVVGAVGAYLWSDQSLSVTAPLEKGFSVSSLEFTGEDPAPPAPEIAKTGSSSERSVGFWSAVTFFAAGAALIVARRRVGLKP
jgi:hypothetical protein